MAPHGVIGIIGAPPCPSHSAGIPAANQLSILRARANIERRVP